MASSLIMTPAPDSTPLRNFAAALPSTTAPLKGLRLWLDLRKRAVAFGVMSRAGRRREYATARVIRPAANPDLPVRARRRLLKRNKLGAADDPALSSHGNLVVRLAVIVATTPFAGRISIAAATDPGIMGKRLRGLGDHPNENDPNSLILFEWDVSCFIACLHDCDARLPRLIPPYVRLPATAYWALPPLVWSCDIFDYLARPPIGTVAEGKDSKWLLSRDPGGGATPQRRRWARMRLQIYLSLSNGSECAILIQHRLHQMCPGGSPWWTVWNGGLKLP